jgi:Domain of unknown function (DUF4399)
MMSSIRKLAVGVGTAGALVLVARPAVAQGMAQTAAPSVHIVSPAPNELITGSSVHVVLEATGVEIAPVSEHKAGTAHHHLFLDADVTPLDQPIPAGVAGIVHLGGGQTEYTFENVAPGQHRLIDVLADPAHVPLRPLVSDTVEFTVKP